VRCLIRLNAVVRRSVYILLALALICGAKLHLPALQVVAWTGMVVKYAQEVPLTEALEMTFDGDHPCPLCKVIRKAQTSEQHEMTAPSVPERIQLFVETTHPWLPVFTTWAHWVGPSAAHAATPLRPPVPPPRTVA
jgi:hypothetical protein